MDISSDYGSDNMRTNELLKQQAAQTEEPAKNTSQNFKFDGEILKGEIADINNNSISITTQNGEEITAEFDNTMEAKIGEQIRFRIYTDVNGNNILDLIQKTTNESKIETMAEALKAADIKVTEENLKLVKLLIDNHMPVNKEMLTMLHRGVTIDGFENVDKSLLLLNNNINVSISNLEKLQSFAQNPTKISDDIRNIVEGVLSLGDSEVKENLLKILLTNSSVEQSPESQKLIQKNISDIIASTKDTVLTDFVKEVFSQNLKQRASETTIEESNTKITELELNTKTKQFINLNKGALLESIRQLAQNGTLTEIDVKEAIKNTPDNNEILKFVNGKNGNETEKLIAITKQIFKESELFDKVKNEVEGVNDIIKITAKKVVDLMAPKADMQLKSELKEFYNNLSAKLIDMSNVVKDSVDLKNVQKQTNNLKESIAFLDQLKNNTYLQFPVSTNNSNTNTELFIFKDKRSKKSTSLSASALISLDLSSLGHFEVYVQKSKNDINCQFRVENNAIEKIVRNNIEILNKLFENTGLVLSNYSFKEITEKFSIFDSNPDEPQFSTDDFLKRFSFDLKA